MPQTIIFHHIQKTGGTSIRRVMREVFGHIMEPRCNPDDTWGPQIAHIVDGKVWAGHMPFGAHEWIGQRRGTIRYFTVIRHPARRLESRYRASHSTEWYDVGIRPAEVYVPRWSMVYQFGGFNRDQLARGLREEHLKIALENLHRFYRYVGRTSRLEETGAWLRDTLGWPITLPLPRENTARLAVEFPQEWYDEMNQIEDPTWELDMQLYSTVLRLGPEPSKW